MEKMFCYHLHVTSHALGATDKTCVHNSMDDHFCEQIWSPRLSSMSESYLIQHCLIKALALASFADIRHKGLINSLQCS